MLTAPDEAWSSISDPRVCFVGGKRVVFTRRSQYAKIRVLSQIQHPHNSPSSACPPMVTQFSATAKYSVRYRGNY